MLADTKEVIRRRNWKKEQTMQWKTKVKRLINYLHNTTQKLNIEQHELHKKTCEPSFSGRVGSFYSICNILRVTLVTRVTHVTLVAAQWQVMSEDRVCLWLR